MKCIIKLMSKISRFDFYLAAIAVFVLIVFLLTAALRSRSPFVEGLIGAVVPQEAVFLLPPANAGSANFSATTITSSSHLVYITPEGFKPKRLSIGVGHTVRWLNVDKKLHWPASDPHPTHTASPGFDSGGNLNEGEVYLHIFTKPGFFVYHDHNQALGGSTSTITGLIEVQ